MFSSPLYPFETDRFELPSGLKLHFIDHGPVTGQPVVMVHGNPTWSFYYRRLVHALCGEQRCLVPDHIGMGLSDRPDDAAYNYTLQSRVDDFGAWLDEVEPDREIDLVVHDWGGAIGLSWAVRNPERVRRVLILNTWAFNIPKDKSLPRSLKFARTSFGGFLIHRFNAFAGLAVTMASAKRLKPDIIRGLLAPYQGSPSQRLATLRFVQDIPLSESDPAWSVLAETEARLDVLADKPVQIAWGARDFVFNDDVLAIWREKLPHAPVEYYEDAGHYVLEDAADRIVPLAKKLFAD
ncbi:MAG: alpha/beta fold hydrolase [Wenzhouxiangella sp.]